MYSDKEVDLARMALYAYNYYVGKLDSVGRNRTGIPEGWSQLPAGERINPITGFRAYAFLNDAGTELVVSYTGTRFWADRSLPEQLFSEPDWWTNINGAVGGSPPLQFGDAVAFFRDLMADPAIPDAAKTHVTFTGHSLGGGLAQVMGVLFARPALGFAAAPFEKKTVSWPALRALTMYADTSLPNFNRLQPLLDIANRPGDPERGFRLHEEALLAALDMRETYAAGLAINDDLVTFYLRNEMLVNTIAFVATVPLRARKAAALIIHFSREIGRGLQQDATEFVTGLPPAADLYLGDANMSWLLLENSGLGLLDRHSMAWHLLLMAHQPLRQLVDQVAELGPVLTRHFGSDPYAPDQVLLNKLVNNHFGVRNDDDSGYIVPPNHLLDTFVAELKQVSQLLPAEASAGIIDKLADVLGFDQEALNTVAAIAAVAYHYWTLPNNMVPPRDFFQAHDWGVSFDLGRIGDTTLDPATGQVGSQEGSSPISHIAGHDDLLWAAIANDLPEAETWFGLPSLTASILDQLQPQGTAAPWHVQVGTAALFHAGDDRNEVFVGGDATADRVAAGAGDDLVAAGLGDDILAGERGNDFLLGGDGDDTYRYQAGDGMDTVIDRDGIGSLEINGVRLAAAETVLTRSRLAVWYSADTDTVLTFQPATGIEPGVGTLLVTGNGLGGADNRIAVRNFRIDEDGLGSLGIRFASRRQLVLQPGNASRNPFYDPAFVPDTHATAAFDAQRVLVVTLAHNEREAATRTIALTATTAGRLELWRDDQWLSLGTEGVAVVLAPGQTMLPLLLRQCGDEDGQVQPVGLFATLAATDTAPAVSHRLMLESFADEEAEASAGQHIVGLVAGAAVGGVGDDLIEGQVVEQDVFWDQHLYGGAGNDRLFAGSAAAENELILAGESAERFLPAFAPADGFFATLQGDAGNDHLFGTRGDDLLVGGGDADLLVGGGGHDTLRHDITGHDRQPEPVGDRLHGGAGNDRLYAGASNDVLDGGNGDDIIYAGDGADVVIAGDGGDRVYGDLEALVNGQPQVAGAGNDTLDGGAGNDLVAGGSGNDVLSGGAGDDVLRGGSAEALRADYSDVWALASVGIASVRWDEHYPTDDDALDGGAGCDILLGGYGNDRLAGGADDDLLLGDFSDAADVPGTSNAALHGDDELAGDDGNDELQGHDGADLLDGGTGNDRLFGGRGDDALLGADGADQLLGDDGDDVLDGGADDDLLSGGAGRDTLDGGDGDDRLAGDAGSDRIVAGDGDDLVLGDQALSQLEAAAHGDDDISAGVGDDTVRAGGGNDRVNGGDGADTLFGDDVGVSGNDVLSGEAGDDTLGGGGGNDLLSGGDGNDRLHGDGGDVPVEWQGADILHGDAGDDELAGYGGDDTLEGGAGSDSLFGMDGADTLAGGDGSDYLDGGAGDDRLDGGEGDDVYFFDAGYGHDTLADFSGNDRLLFGPGLTADALQFTLGSLALRFAGSDVEVHIADFNPLDALASAAIETVAFRAADGSVRSYTLGELLQQRGFDIAGDQQALGTSLADRIRTGDQGALVLAGAGNDDLHGGAGNDDLAGERGDDVLDGGAGHDMLRGGPGNDTYVLRDDDLTEELPLAGVDVVLAANDHRLAPCIENLVLTGSARQGTGNELDNRITGNALANLLSGLAGDDHLLGGDGADELDGGVGIDRLEGGAGDDSYRVDAHDLIIEQSAGGHDTVYSSDTHVLAPDVEDLVLAGDRAIDGTGNALANHIVGNDADNHLRGNPDRNAEGAADLLEGGAGNDRFGDQALGVFTTGGDIMVGGPGDDTFFMRGGDQVMELPGEGHDTIYLHGIHDYDLPAGVEDLCVAVTIGVRGVTVRGNALDNRLRGHDANNALYGGDGADDLRDEFGEDLLDGGGGADYMNGGRNADTYYVDHADDVAEEDGNFDSASTRDQVYAAVTHGLGAWLEDLTLTGADAIDGRGNPLGNTLVGNGAANRLTGDAGDDRLLGNAGDDVLQGDDGVDWLDGGSGADRMTGGADDDHYEVDDAGDRVIEEDAGGIDEVQSAIDYALPAATENLRLTYAGVATHATGNGLANRIVGNVQDNVLDGGAGDDLLCGGPGDDIYLFARGGGSDEFQDAEYDGYSGGDDVLQFAAGIAADDVQLSQPWLDGSLPGCLDTGEKFLIGRWQDPDATIEWLAFADGTRRGVADITHALGNTAPLAQADEAGRLGGLVREVSGRVTANDSDDRTASTALRITGVAGSWVLPPPPPPTGGAPLPPGIPPPPTGQPWSPQPPPPPPVDTRIRAGVGSNAGSYGTLELASDGSYTYRVDASAPAVSALADGEVLSEVFLYTVSDEEPLFSRTSRATLTVTIAALAVEQSLDLYLVGTSDADALTGGDGNDTLDGAGGADVLVGGNGDDIYYVDTFLYGGHGNEGLGNGLDAPPPGHADDRHDGPGAWPGVAARMHANDAALARAVAWFNRVEADVPVRADVVVEEAGGGHDCIHASVTCVLAGEVEDLVLTGVRPAAGYGNALANRLTGNAADNLLSGAAGDDALDGGAGGDTLRGGTGNDLLSGGDGDDLLLDDSGDGVLAGGGGDDLLIGSHGANLLSGGAGNDVILSSGARDLLLFNRGDGCDRVLASGGELVLGLGDALGLDNLSLRRSGKALQLDLGAGDMLTLDHWYAQDRPRPQLLMQFFDSVGHASNCYDLGALAATSDAALRGNAAVDLWALPDAITQFLLADNGGGASAGAPAGEPVWRTAGAPALWLPGASAETAPGLASCLAPASASAMPPEWLRSPLSAWVAANRPMVAV